VQLVCKEQKATGPDLIQKLDSTGISEPLLCCLMPLPVAIWECLDGSAILDSKKIANQTSVGLVVAVAQILS